MTPVVVSAEDYTDATESYRGWCPKCTEFTTDCVEPDASGYKCEACGQMTVMGAEDALMMGEIDIGE